MLTKAQINEIKALHHKKERDAQGTFVAEGDKLIGDLLNAGAQASIIYTTKDSVISSHSMAVQVQLHELQKMSQLKNPSHSLAVFNKPEVTWNPSGLVVVLQTIQDPGNVGTIIRTADWFGIDQIICLEGTCDVYNHKVVQASMGSIYRVSIHVCDIREATELLKGYTWYYATMNGESIYQTNRAKQSVLVIGSEGQGIDVEALPSDAIPVTIPKFGGAESLNASMAFGIIASHWLKG